jgi:hypothetical protein
MQQMQEALRVNGRIPPRHRTLLLEREAAVILPRLLTDGLTVQAKGGGETHITFEQIGRPFKPRRTAGWRAVKVKSSFGGVTTLLLEGGARVSGLVKLRGRA